MTLKQIAGFMGAAGLGSIEDKKMAAELALRQATAQISATRYMLWSVVALTITSGLNALFAFLSWYLS